MTKRAESLHMARVADMGCIVCKNVFNVHSLAEIHHLRTGQGAGQRASNYQVIPLCPQHHRLGGYGVAIHAGQKEWERRYGTELELLAQVEQLLELENA
ncbi:Ref family recombination enhancement nuclease [Martelella alba]|uniref:DUF968 domain-containing protein n=1 Tax=Martelella alba TaxID=2590451 RepID=A0ABY2SL63_9HYPH|nr:Ref family recombination enhancement nuclease [Martelella alba]TKI06394.1 DUF968 domain-containing protein [Martelella alba]